MLSSFFQDSREKKSPKTQNLGNESFYYNEPSARFKKVDKIFGKKSRREKKEQHCLQQAWNSGTPTTNANVAHNGRIQNVKKCKDLSHITCFNYDKKCHYTDKYLEPREGCDTAKN